MWVSLQLYYLQTGGEYCTCGSLYCFIICRLEESTVHVGLFIALLSVDWRRVLYMWVSLQLYYLQTGGKYCTCGSLYSFIICRLEERTVHVGLFIALLSVYWRNVLYMWVSLQLYYLQTGGKYCICGSLYCFIICINWRKVLYMWASLQLYYRQTGGKYCTCGSLYSIIISRLEDSTVHVGLFIALLSVDWRKVLYIWASLQLYYLQTGGKYCTCGPLYCCIICRLEESTVHVGLFIALLSVDWRKVLYMYASLYSFIICGLEESTVHVGLFIALLSVARTGLFQRYQKYHGKGST